MREVSLLAAKPVARPAACEGVLAWLLAGALLLWTMPAKAGCKHVTVTSSQGETIGVPFPAPPVPAPDLRESLSTSKDCLHTIQPYRMSKQELQELRRAIRAQAKMPIGEERKRDRRKQASD